MLFFPLCNGRVSIPDPFGGEAVEYNAAQLLALARVKRAAGNEDDAQQLERFAHHMIEPYPIEQ